MKRVYRLIMLMCSSFLLICGGCSEAKTSKTNTDKNTTTTEQPTTPAKPATGPNGGPLK